MALTFMQIPKTVSWTHSRKGKGSYSDEVRLRVRAKGVARLASAVIPWQLDVRLGVFCAVQPQKSGRKKAERSQPMFRHQVNTGSHSGLKKTGETPSQQVSARGIIYGVTPDRGNCLTS